MRRRGSQWCNMKFSKLSSLQSKIFLSTNTDGKGITNSLVLIEKLKILSARLLTVTLLKFKSLSWKDIQALPSNIWLCTFSHKLFIESKNFSDSFDGIFSNYSMLQVLIKVIEVWRSDTECPSSLKAILAQAILLPSSLYKETNIEDAGTWRNPKLMDVKSIYKWKHLHFQHYLKSQKQ